MGIWESIAVSALALLIIYVYRPGLRAALEKSRQAESQDWRSLLTPLILVILFIVLLIVIARSTSSKHNPPPEDLLDTRLESDRAVTVAMLAPAVWSADRVHT
jgi:archaellum biogenesis protein FlaJ (TadC family)